MKIVRVEAWQDSVPLTRPYRIASRAEDQTSVDLFFVRIVTDTVLCGLGSASPVELVTGETPAACAAALTDGRWSAFEGRDARPLGALCRAAEELAPDTPAARAAVDIALHDLFARHVGVPLCDLLGRRRGRLPTSITIGIKDLPDALAEADEYLRRGFRCLKVKIGRSLRDDLERLRALRARVGHGVRIRVDANQGYTLAETLELCGASASLDLELVEQPVPRAALAELRELPAEIRALIALDESLCDERDAIELVQEPMPAAVWVIKLMKCGGIRAALRQAEIAGAAGRGLMWGCMDESAIGIAAALHAAYASDATRYLDLDGSFDLARDPAEGGFSVEDGVLVPLDQPGLGVRLRG